MVPGTRKLFMYASLFVLLTLAGGAYAVWRSPMRPDDLWAIVLALPGTTIALLIALCAAIYFTDVLRFRSVAHAVGTTVPWRAGLDASVANFFFSWITPGATFGVPATIYMLGRRGVPWDATVAIAFAKSFSGVALLVVASVAFVITGLGPDYDGGVLAIVLIGGSGFAFLCVLLIIAAYRPARAQRVIARGFGWLGRRFGRGPRLTSAEDVTLRSVDRLALLEQGGAGPLLWVLATHALYFTAFAGVGLVLIHTFGGAVELRSFAAVIIYLAFTYLAPSPGGAGFAEALALPFFGPVLPADKAVMFVLCFRGITLYLQIGFAIPYMLIVGGLGEIARRQR